MTPTDKPKTQLRARPARSRRAPSRRERAAATRAPRAERVQRLTILLEGIMAGDYLTFVRDAEPAALDGPLRGADAFADPLGDRIDVLLRWDAEPPAPPIAARMAGFPLIVDVACVREAAVRQLDGA